MLKRSCLAAGLCLAVLAGPAQAQVVPYYFSLADLEKIFVENKQYFVLDDEGFDDASFNHLHFTTIDTTTGAFTGAIWAPELLPAAAQQVIPVTGMLTIHQGSSYIGPLSPSGNHYEIEFSWTISSICSTNTASYHGAIAFLGYQGAKMRGTIAGKITSNYSACGISTLPYSPQPFSGVLTK